MTHYFIFGDSIALGEGDPHGGWAKKLSQEHSVENLSVDGATTNDLLKNFPTTINNQSTLIIALGVNDSIFIPLTQFKQNLIQIINPPQKHTKNIVFVGPAPVDQPKVGPIPWESDYSYINQTIEQFSQAIADICIKKKLKFIDLFHQLPETYIQTLPDGIHPNPLGHKMIFELIKLHLK